MLTNNRSDVVTEDVFTDGVASFECKIDGEDVSHENSISITFLYF